MFFKYIFIIILPFIIGFLIANILKKVSKSFSKLLKLNYKTAAIVISTLFYLLSITLLIILFNIIIKELIEILNIIIKEDKLKEFLLMIDKISSSFNININSQEIFQKLISFLILIISDVSKTLPNMLTSTACIIISSIIFTIDYYNIKKIFENFIDKTKFKTITKIKFITIKNLKNIIKAQFLIATFSFFFLLISFIIIKFKYFITFSLIIALFDFLPIIGTSAFFIPWIIFELTNKNHSFSLQLLIIYFLVNLLRSIIEPNILSAQMKIHPLINIISMYVGIKIMGFWGITVFPLFSIIIVELYREKIKNDKKLI